MGLAASQARFLAITARKANCEFKSMQIAQEKMSISRELDKATTEYQSAINTTKLVWDADGSGENTFTLNYDLMMRPSALNNYTPYMVTTKDGRIVLDSGMAAAARQAGIPEEGCTNKTVTLPNGQVTTLYDQLYGQFINQMVKNGSMSETSATAVRAIGLVDNVGIGAPLLDKTQASQMGINDLINYMNEIVSNSKYGTKAEQELADALKYNLAEYATSYSYDPNTKQIINSTTATLDFKTSLADKGDSNSNYLVVNNTKVKGDTEITLPDLLTDDVTFAKTSDANSVKWWKKVLAAIMSIPTLGIAYSGIKHMLGVTTGGYPEGMTEEDKALLDFVDEMVESFAKLFDVENGDDLQQQAFQYAIQQTLSLLSDCKSLGNRNHSVDAFNDAVNDSNKYNGWVYKGANKDKNYGTQAISLSNLAESFMTFYAQGLNGYDDTYYINNASAKSHYVTDDPFYMWTVSNENATTAQEMYVAEFYSAMFNNIVQNGWVENDQIDDEEYLKNTLKNATYFISSLSSDNYYYQDRYTDNGYVIEVQDDDAIREAEIAYTQLKHKLNAKEEKLDLDMKKLDLEISSLTTEYDTVKNLINTNVEKTFTMFN